ncbi:FAS1 domain [Dillenia turbinata]|uniref:FAS1 domain n=1 Tax=Dillenia turbinata TaxID=194707 RepID=A0AAN8UVP1_9MAGN
MAKLSGDSSLKVTFFILLILIFTVSVTGITDQELENAIAALRSQNYGLFGNAISTSDLRYELLDGNNFTLFSPINSAVFSLDMLSDASNYVQTLRYHIAPRHFTVSDLRNLSLYSYVESLVPNYSLLIQNRNIGVGSTSEIRVGGIMVSVPDLYLGSGIAVHGLDGILTVRFRSPKKLSCGPAFLAPNPWPIEFFPPRSSPRPRSFHPSSIPPASSPEDESPQSLPPESFPPENLPKEPAAPPEISKNSGSREPKTPDEDCYHLHRNSPHPGSGNDRKNDNWHGEGFSVVVVVVVVTSSVASQYPRRILPSWAVKPSEISPLRKKSMTSPAQDWSLNRESQHLDSPSKLSRAARVDSGSIGLAMTIDAMVHVRRVRKSLIE